MFGGFSGLSQASYSTARSLVGDAGKGLLKVTWEMEDKAEEEEEAPLHLFQNTSFNTARQQGRVQG